MQYTRILPDSDDLKQSVLSVAKERKDDVDPDDNPISTANSAKLDLLEPGFRAARNAVAQAEEDDNKAVNECDLAFLILRYYASHGLQLVGNLVIDRIGGFLTSTLKLYNLDLNGNLPPYNSEDEIISMAGDFNQGETDRIAGGGTALVDYNKTTCLVKLNDAKAKRLVKLDTHNSLITAQHNLKVKREEVDNFIPNMWDDIENATQQMTKEEGRNYCKTWGVKYKHINDTGVLIITAIDFDSGEKLAGVEFFFSKTGGETGAKGKTDNNGNLTIESRNFDPSKLLGKLALYYNSIDDVTINPDEPTYITVKMRRLPK